MNEQEKEILELKIDQKIQQQCDFVLRPILAQAIVAVVPDVEHFIAKLKSVADGIQVDAPSADFANKYGEQVAGMFSSSVQQRIDRELLIFIGLLKTYTSNAEK